MTEKLVLSVEELAQEFGISLPVAYALAKREGFPAVRISERRIVVPVEALRRWLEAEVLQQGVGT